jgi:acyl carrier protein
MDPSSSSANHGVAADAAQKIQHLPAEAQAAFRRFQQERDPALLDPLILAILENYVPKKRAQPVPVAELPGDSRLVEDLGFDSLAITEVVFFTEDLLGINIANEEILTLRTLDDLRNFIRQKVAARNAA